VVEIQGLPVTTVARTLMDLASQLHPLQLKAAVEDSIAAGKTTMPSLLQVLHDVARKGKPGVTAMRDLLDGWCGEARSVSVLESRGNKLLRDAGLNGFKTEYPIPWSLDRRFDVGYDDECVAVEWDSRRWHLQSLAFESDRMRDRQAVLHGWRVLRFSWADVHLRPEDVVATVRAVLGR
jgi:very-short-patch-repair endonuclease